MGERTLRLLLRWVGKRNVLRGFAIGDLRLRVQRVRRLRDGRSIGIMLRLD